ncbi:MAG: GIY-YIG nuclease family protein [Patescibacteria group bacterium]
MFYVYVLKSVRDGELYIGSTNNLRTRASLHNNGKVLSTKRRSPFTLIYYEAYTAEGDARHRESNLKSRGQARRQLLGRISGGLLRGQS